jgi:hypothetical protein
MRKYLRLQSGIPLFGILIGLALLLSSCIGIKSTVTFNRDGSGVVEMEYRISKMITEMGEGEEGVDVPLPISEEDLEASLADNPNLTLRSVSQREDETDTYITAEIEFKKVEEFTDVEDFSEMPMKLEKNGNEYTFAQLISEGTEGEEEEEMDAETKAMMESFFEGYELVFTVEAPAPITEYNLGELASDKRSVTFAIPLLEMNNLKEETVLEVKWKI